MRKSVFIICLCIVCGWSCTGGDIQEKKDSCQKVCDSLTVAQAGMWTIEKVENAKWKKRKVSTVIVGTVPVPVNGTRDVSGSILFMNNGQKVLTTYVNVPVGALLIQKPIYEPRRVKGDYLPELVGYRHYIWADDKAYELDYFELI